MVPHTPPQLPHLQDKTVLEIVKDVLGFESRARFRIDAITGLHPPHVYCVQYRETDLDFISRLMEEEGLFTYFEHDEGGHTLVISDANQGFGDCTPFEAIYTQSLGNRELSDNITRWERHFTFSSGAYAHTDYNPETSQTDLGTDRQGNVPLDANRDYEIYDYPGRHEDPAHAEHFARLRMEEADMAYEIIQGEGNSRAFQAGCRFALIRHHEESEQDNVYILTAVYHEASQPASYITGGEASEGQYRNRFRCIPENVPFRTPRRTPRPTIRGAQTATVVGPASEEIYVDEMHRVKVEFHWDRRGLKNENSSCWIRVAQPTAGAGWGTVAIPRIGHEVLVHFLEGDPDRPLIMGSVYNDANMPPASSAGRKPDEAPPPAALPAAKMMTTLRSNSLGKTGGFNEITMNDTKGQETLYIKAQHNEYHEVGNDRRDDVGNDETTTIQNNRTETVVNGDETVTIKTGNRTITVGTGEQTVNVKQDATLSVKDGNRNVEVLSASYNLDAKTDIVMKAETGKIIGEALADAAEITAKTVQITGLEEITLTVGPSSIKINASGIFLNGPHVKCN